MALRCKQCGDTKDDNGWTVCGECMTRNDKYRHQCVIEARRIRKELAKTLCRTFREPGARLCEMKDRKARAPRVVGCQPEEFDDDD